MNPDQTINWNAAECLQKTNHWGLTIVQNICNGKSFDVPWGSWDFVLALLAVAGLCLGLAFLAAMAMVMIKISIWD